MNRILFNYLILTTAIIVVVSGCSSTGERDTTKAVTVTIMPQKYMVEKIAGDLFTIHVMIPPDANPHHFDPSPRQIMNLANSQLYFKIGYIDFELTWINKLESEYPAIHFIDTSEGVELMDDENSECGHLHGNIDPHIWSSPRNMKTIAANMAKAFILHDPENQSIYIDNLKIFEQELDSIDNYISKKLAQLENRSFLIYHPALTYFAKDFGLEQIAIENEGKESSVRHFRSIVSMAKDKNIRTIFVQQQFNSDEARTLEKEIHGKII
ncbi:MAG: metal ABC transporter solute-binding protein, Zn/Mn family, partial [Bacteroidales bacterium]